MRLLNVDEVAKVLSVSVRTVWRLVSAGELPPPMKVGKRLRRWRARDIENYINGDRPKSKPSR